MADKQDKVSSEDDLVEEETVDDVQIDFESLSEAQNDAAGDDDYAKLRGDLQEANDRVLRSQAELENYRRRARREAQEERKYALKPFLTDLLPVIDNINRALEAAEQSDADESGLLEGFQIVSQQLLTVLESHGCTKIEAMGETFDPNMHEAIQQMPSDEIETGAVMLVAQEGYRLHDRVVRPAQVIVSTGAAE